MARTSLAQAQPADERIAFLSTSGSRLNALRLVQERARMALSKARVALLSTPKDHPERAFRSNQFRLARQAHEQSKSDVVEFEKVIDYTKASVERSRQAILSSAIAKAEEEQRAWSDRVKQACEPYEFVLTRKGGKLRMGKTSVRAPCGQACINEQSARDHSASCPACQAAIKARTARESVILEI